MAIPNFRCLWNPYQCLPKPPVCDYAHGLMRQKKQFIFDVQVNSVNPLVPCKFNRERCLSFEDCCSVCQFCIYPLDCILIILWCDTQNRNTALHRDIVDSTGCRALNL